MPSILAKAGYQRPHLPAIGMPSAELGNSNASAPLCREMVMAVPTASWFDPGTEQCVQRVVDAPDSVTGVVEDVLGLRSSRGHPAVEFARDEGSSLSVATDGRRALVVWADTLGETFQSVGSSGGPVLIFDYFGSWSEAHIDCLVPLIDALDSVAQFRIGKPETATVVYLLTDRPGGSLSCRGRSTLLV
jgi:hypothetical protein